MIGFWLALVLWMVGAGPTPTPHGLTVPPATTAPAAAPHAHPAAPRSESTAPATVAEPTNGVELWDSPGMCNDPVDCPAG